MTYLDDAGEHSFETLVCLALLLALLNILCELIEQVIDNLGREDLNTVLVSEVLRIRRDSDIKGQHDSIFLVGSLV